MCCPSSHIFPSLLCIVFQSFQVKTARTQHKMGGAKGKWLGVRSTKRNFSRFITKRTTGEMQWVYRVKWVYKSCSKDCKAFQKQQYNTHVMAMNRYCRYFHWIPVHICTVSAFGSIPSDDKKITTLQISRKITPNYCYNMANKIIHCVDS